MIKYYNRKNNKYEVEKVPKERYLKWIYSSKVGMGFLEMFITKKFFSQISAIFCNSKFSKNKIYKFYKTFDIDIYESKKNIKEFNSFNDFFSRELKEGARSFNASNDILISPCDGKVMAYENINLDNIFKIKDYNYKLSNLINNYEVAKRYSNGTCLIFRLCPADYHRFHFIDDGTCTKNNIIKGKYYSVNPIAFKSMPNLFCQNKRSWSILKSNNFGEVLYIEVGATFVGTIVQTYNPNEEYKKAS